MTIEEGCFVLVADGALGRFKRAWLPDDGYPNTYSAWDVLFNPALADSGAPAVELNGAITIDLDFTPPAGFRVTSFGVVTLQPGLSALRLVVSDGPGEFNGNGVSNFFDVIAGLRLIDSGAPEGDPNGDGTIR